MLVHEFNEKYNKQLKLVHRHDFREGHHFLAQWCPVAKKYDRMNTLHLDIHRCHFDGFDVPERFLESVEKFATNGFRRNLVLIAEEKHGTCYFDGCTVELLGCAVLQLLNRRLRENWYEVYDDPKKPEVTVEQVRDSAKISKIVAKEWRYYNSQMNYRKNALSLVDDIKKYTENREYFKALSLLQSRNDHEYEKVEVESLEVASTNLDFY